MHEIPLSADELVAALLNLPPELNLCLLDSCGVSHLGSHLLIAGFNPIEIEEITHGDPLKTLAELEQTLSRPGHATILTISYDFGMKLNRLKSRHFTNEADAFVASFDCLIIHNYTTGKTFVTGNENRFREVEGILSDSLADLQDFIQPSDQSLLIESNFSRKGYIEAVETVKEYIRRGDTYQTNLTRRIEIKNTTEFCPERIFSDLRANHPAPFAGFLHRKNDVVISASPERFFKVQGQQISVSPIKGTRPRGVEKTDDAGLKAELLLSEKDRAENTMIVDLLRNDIGRICKFGTVEVEKLCDLEEHPTLFHLVSTVNGQLRPNVTFPDIMQAVFPCGSITGAPKIRTMQIIDEVETAARGLSMGAIGYCGFDKTIDFSVAIRTAVINKNNASFNVGGGIVIDSIPEKEWEETEVKSLALLNAISVK